MTGGRGFKENNLHHHHHHHHDPQGSMARPVSADRQCNNREVLSHPSEGELQRSASCSGPSVGPERSLVPTPNQKKTILVTMALCLVLALSALDQTIVATALPTMASTFSVSASGYGWMGSSYLLASAATAPVWGRVSDIWSRKPMLLLATFIFLVGSLVCAQARNLSMVVAGRAIQGTGSGGISILANVCISDLTSPRDRGMYYGIIGSVRATSSALGPIVGGALTSRASWRWCFYLNLPAGGLGFIILLFFPQIKTTTTPLLEGVKAIDWLGTTLLIGGTVAFVFGLQSGGVDYPWGSATVMCLIVFGVAIYMLAILVEWRVAKFPLMPLHHFATRHNAVVFLICFSHSGVFFAGSYFTPVYFQTALLLSPLMSGVCLLPMVLSLAISSTATGIIIKHTGHFRTIIVLGLVLFTLGYGLYIDFPFYVSWPRIIIYQLVTGTGTGPLAQAPLLALQAALPPADNASASSTFGFIRQLSAAISIVIGTVIHQNVWASQLPRVTQAIGAKHASAIEPFSISADSLESLSDDQRTVVLDAVAVTLSRMWIFYVALAGFALLSTVYLRSIPLSKAHGVVQVGLEEQRRARRERLAARKRHDEV